MSDLEIETTTKPKRKRRTATKAAAPQVVRSQWFSRLIIEGHQTPSGTRYDFGPGEAKAVNTLDYQFLLDLQPKQKISCCGGSPNANSHTIKFFCEVK